MTKPQLFKCGKQEAAPVPYHYKECGIDNIFIINGYHIETFDGEEYVSIHNVDGLHKAIGLSLVAKKKDLEPSEIRFLRHEIDVSQADLASMLRVDDQTVARWEKKRCKMPGPADIALRFLYLSSPAAQPEGKEVISNMHEQISQLVEMDDTGALQFTFEVIGKSDKWKASAAPRLAYA